MNHIPERDWKVFAELQPVALNRFCERILDEVRRLLADDKQGSHEKYLALFKLIQDRDDQIARAFNDYRRSTAERQLVIIQKHELLTPEEMGRFSEETRKNAEGSSLW